MKSHLDAKFSSDPNNSRLNSSRPRGITQADADAEEGGGHREEEEEVNIVPGHPKLEKLREMVVEHFK